ncbi:uncharacterized protein PAC_08076 [Phialocephala subalpina]|uniref:Uncharacterized protein n=1 Tax=Phialocephala subalpina TaxID=576137 RepID=A0A1L7WZI6_9HELO|nr:uncharacterized protein PAC_08076 [Phialocephala subalpina]
MSSHLPAFLTLPYELRLEIYGLVLDQRLGYFPRSYLSISSVNRQIRQEVLPLVLRNSRYFSSLEKLSDWASRGDPVLLKQIQNVTVHIFEDSLIPIADALASNSKDDLPRTRIGPRFWRTMSAPQVGRVNTKPTGRQSLRTRLLSALSISPADIKTGSSKDSIASAWDAFAAIKDVKKLWILFKDSTHPSSRRSFPVEQELILDIIATTCHHVQEFTVFSELVSLDYLSHFQDLRLLRFGGYSKSDPEETLRILKSLKKLDTLIIYRYPEGYDIDNNITTSKLPQYLALTPHVIAQLNPLKHFQVSHMSSIIESQHINVPVLQALRNHLPWLRIFQLSSDFPLMEEIVEDLLEFLAESRITDLKIRVKIPKRFEEGDVVSFFPKTCKNGEASTRNANVPDLVHLAMTASGACHHITHVNRMCVGI